MRKKIFVIHGKGVVNGLGTEGGGDLDTVGSNAFYAAWIKNVIKKEENRAAEYGTDYEFDFVNYQAGLSHLKIHKGCDIYIPDFPVDALSPRLKLLLLNDEEDIKVRTKMVEAYDDFKLNIYSHASFVDNDLKALFNSLINKVKTYISDLSKYEIAFLNELYSIFNNVISILSLTIDKNKNSAGKVVSVFKTFFIGMNFKLIRDELYSTLNQRIFPDLKDKYISRENSLLIKDLNEFRKFYFSSSFKIKISENLIVFLIESFNFLRKLRLILNKHNKSLTKEDVSTLTEIFNKACGLILKEWNRFSLFIDEIKFKDPELSKLNNNIKTNIKNSYVLFKLLKNIKGKGKQNKIIVMLIEDENLIPAQNVEIVFTKIKGDIQFVSKGKKSNNKINLKTDRRGSCVLNLTGRLDKDYYINITHDDMGFLKFTNIQDEEVLKGIEEDDSIVSKEKMPEDVSFESEEELSVEKGDTPSMAQQVACQLIEKDFKILKKNGIHIVRIDDHHPWTKEIINLLNTLKEDGFITENITMSGPPRGEEQPKHEQKCGTDLIYESLIKNSEFDNPGYQFLCYLAHVQDLHIKEDRLAIAISKLIGSGYSKIEMAEKFSMVRLKKDIKNLMRKNEWAEVVRKYEKSLEEVLPRVEKNIVKVTLLLKPENNNYRKNLGLGNLLMPFTLFSKNKDRMLRKLYTLNPKNKLNIYMVLSPFTDKKAGEVKINVASTINYLKDKFKIDYLFYCYGSMLMTTRKVNPKKKGINLSTWVAYIGTRADGGHPEAATGKPSSNPAFPDIFTKVNDANFYEYAFYIAEKVSEFSNMEILDVEEAKITQYEDEIESVLQGLEKNLLTLNFKDKDGMTIKLMLVKNIRGLNISAAVNYLVYRKKYEFDYLLFAQGTERLIVRNINDFACSIDINNLVKAIGSNDDKGYLKVGVAYPKNNKKFPVNTLKFINTFNYIEYAYYLKDRILEGSALEFINIEEKKQKNSSPVFKNKLLQIRSTMWSTLFNYKGRNYKIIFAYAPPSSSLKEKDSFSITTAFAYIKKITSPDIIFYTDGFRIVIRKYENCELPLSELMLLFIKDREIISEYYSNFIIKDLTDFKKYYNDFMNPLAFPILVEYINMKISKKESVQIIKSERI